MLSGLRGFNTTRVRRQLDATSFAMTTRLLARHSAGRESSASTAERSAHAEEERDDCAESDPVGVALQSSQHIPSDQPS